MKNLASLRWVLFAVVAGGAAGGVMTVGCSGDDTQPHPPYDASNDTGKDTGRDTGSDTGTDTGSDAGDAGDGARDAEIDSNSNFDAGPPGIERYSQQINALYCQKLAQCCGSANFNRANCERLFNNEKNVTGIALNRTWAPYQDGGKLALDGTKAQKCFDDINRLGCGALSSERYRELYDDCLGGALGTVELDGGCSGTPECLAPNHCEKPDGSATGRCAEPRPTGAQCNDGIFDVDGNEDQRRSPWEPNFQCGNNLTGIPGYCANGDTYVGDTTNTTTCAAPAAAGQQCWNKWECSTYLCDGQGATPGRCVTEFVHNNQATCNYYGNVDSGPPPVRAPGSRQVSPN